MTRGREITDMPYKLSDSQLVAGLDVSHFDLLVHIFILLLSFVHIIRYI